MHFPRNEGGALGPGTAIPRSLDMPGMDLGRYSGYANGLARDGMYCRSDILMLPQSHACCLSSFMHASDRRAVVHVPLTPRTA